MTKSVGIDCCNYQLLRRVKDVLEFSILSETLMVSFVFVALRGESNCPIISCYIITDPVAMLVRQEHKKVS